MKEAIFSRWRHQISQSGPKECIPLFQQSNVLVGLIHLLLEPDGDYQYFLPRLLDLVETNNIPYKSFIDSLFKLRDLLKEHLGENGNSDSSFQKAQSILQEIIIKVSSYFSYMNMDLNITTLRVQSLETDRIEGNILYLDHNFNIIKAKSTLLNQFGYQKSEVLGEPLSILFSGSSQNILKNAFHNLRDYKRYQMELEVEGQRKDGQRFQALLKISRTSGEQPPAAFSVYIKDNTYIHETKSMLNLLSMALESVGEGIIILEPNEDARLLFVNEAMEKMSGFARHQLLGKPLINLRNPPQPDDLEKQIILKSLDGGWNGEIINHHRKGHQYLVELHTQPIRDEYGKTIAIVGIERDITQIKNRESEILYLKQFVEHIINNLPSFVIVTDEEFNIRFWNEAIAGELQIPPKRAINKNIFDLVPTLKRLNINRAVQNLLKNGLVFSKKFLGDFGTDSPRYFQIHLNTIPGNNEKLILWTLRDITKEELLKVRITWQNARLKFLENFSQLLNSNLNLEKILERFTQELKEILPFKTLSFLIPVNLSEQIFLLQFFVEDGDVSFPQNSLLKLQDVETYAELIKRRNYIVRNLYGTDSNLAISKNEPEYDKNIRQIVHLPICFEDEVLGILNISHGEAEYFKQDDLDFLQQIAIHLSIALKNSSYFNVIETQNQKLSIINKIYQISQSEQSQSRIWEEARSGLAALLQCDAAAFYISEDGTHWKLFGKAEKYQLPELLEINDFSEEKDYLILQNPDELNIMFEQTASSARYIHFCWAKSLNYKFIGFLSSGSRLLKKLRPEAISQLVSDVIKQMASSLDQLLLSEKIQQAEQQWKKTFDTVNIGLAIVDSQFRIQQTNRAFCQLFNKTESELINQKCKTAVCHPSSRKECCMEGPHLRLDKQISNEYYDEDLGKHLQRTFYPLFDKGGNHFIGGIFAITDVTQFRSQEKKIKFLSRFPETNPNIVFSLDSNGKLEYMNPAAQKTLNQMNLPASEFYKILPSDWRDLLTHFESQSELMLERTHEFGNRVFEYIIYRPSGENHFYLYGNDVTEKKALHQQLLQTERIRAVGEMAAGVAHDFNNLLATILGRTQLLLLKSADESIRSELEVIEKAALDGGEIVQRIQEVTRERRGKSYRPVNLNEIIEESLVFSANKLKVNTQLKGHAVDLYTDLADNLVVKGNPVELKEVFTNLFINAYDAMPEGGNLYITSRKIENNQAYIVIRDTGIGMSEEVRDKIFNPFFTTKGEKGTGLGLAIVYNNVTQHGGSIRIESEPGKGTEFHITLPLTDEIPDQEIQEKEELEDTVSELRLLIVDDEPELLTTMAEILRLKFKTVDIADSGKSALEQIKQENYDVILTDLGMPEMSGWELARRTKQQLPDAHIIMVTGWGDQAREELKHHDYVDDILPKPYELNHLLKKIQKRSQKSSSPKI
ncbi:MAG: hypothetical protein Kow0037_14040 [Calditrichia bacterium]